MDSEHSSSASCRIIVISSTIEAARDIAIRIKNLAGDREPSDESLGVIPWTIKNKYYTAPVHFQPSHFEGLESLDLDGVPAVIYAWEGKEPFKTHLPAIKEELEAFSSSPEVALAISMGSFTGEAEEDYFFDLGFEYIEGNQEVAQVTSTDFDSSLGLSRAVDALSTIMWPSMIRHAPSSKGIMKMPPMSSIPGELERELASFRDYDASKSNRQLEMEKLERWLQMGSDGEDEGGFDTETMRISLESPLDDPWTMGSSLFSTNRASSKLGFDDDFADFVSAPPLTRPKGATNVSGGLEEDSDLELPSEVDIKSTAARIFGAYHPSTDADASQAFPSSSQSANSISHVDSSFHDAMKSFDSELDIHKAPFDLSRVFSVLEGMKEEVALIPDQAEREKAAARVALALVYGLDEMK